MQILLAYLLGGPHDIQTKQAKFTIFCNQKSLFSAFVVVDFCISQVERNII